MLQINSLIAANPAFFLVVAVLLFIVFLFAAYYGKVEWNGRTGSYHGGHWKDAASHEKTDE